MNHDIQIYKITFTAKTMQYTVQLSELRDDMWWTHCLSDGAATEHDLCIHVQQLCMKWKENRGVMRGFLDSVESMILIG